MWNNYSSSTFYRTCYPINTMGISQLSNFIAGNEIIGHLWNPLVHFRPVTELFYPFILPKSVTQCDMQSLLDICSTDDVTLPSVTDCLEVLFHLHRSNTIVEADAVVLSRVLFIKLCSVYLLTRYSSWIVVYVTPALFISLFTIR